jgi:cell cycle checkpoint protein
MLKQPVAIEPTSYRLLLALEYPRNYHGSAQSSPSVCTPHLGEQTRTDLMHRDKQKVVKPQFFEAFRKERDNYELLNTAAGYIAKKGVLACTAMALKEEDEEMEMSAVNEYGVEGMEGRPWGGMLSKTVLAVEMIPMMIKIQAMSKSRLSPLASIHCTILLMKSGPLLPLSVQPMTIPTFTNIRNTLIRPDDELTAKDNNVEEDGYEEGAAGEDGLGGAAALGWDVGAADKEELGDEKGWLEDDDIQDWD